MGIQWNMESLPAMHNVQLVAVGIPQNLNGWRRLERGPQAGPRGQSVPVNPRGVSFLFMGILIVTLLAYSLASQPRRLPRLCRIS